MYTAKMGSTVRQSAGVWGVARRILSLFVTYLGADLTRTARHPNILSRLRRTAGRRRSASWLLCRSSAIG